MSTHALHRTRTCAPSVCTERAKAHKQCVLTTPSTAWQRDELQPLAASACIGHGHSAGRPADWIARWSTFSAVQRSDLVPAWQRGQQLNCVVVHSANAWAWSPSRRNQHSTTGGDVHGCFGVLRQRARRIQRPMCDLLFCAWGICEAGSAYSIPSGAGSASDATHHRSGGSRLHLSRVPTRSA